MLSSGFIETTAIFTTKEYLDACGNTQANRNLLSRAVKAGRVLRIKQGLYASNSGRYRDYIHNKYLIVKAVDPEALLCYNSAFELFAGQQNLVSATSFFTNKILRPFEFQNQIYQAFPLPKNPPKARGFRQLDGSVVRGTTPEQTIIDSLEKPDRCLGIENVLRIVSTMTAINIEELSNLLKDATSPVRARVGWVLEQKRESWHISGDRIMSLQEGLGKGPFYFTPDHARIKGAYDGKWRLYFPEPISTMKEWVNG